MSQTSTCRSHSRNQFSYGGTLTYICCPDDSPALSTALCCDPKFHTFHRQLTPRTTTPPPRRPTPWWTTRCAQMSYRQEQEQHLASRGARYRVFERSCFLQEIKDSWRWRKCLHPSCLVRKGLEPQQNFRAFCTSR